MENKNTRDTRFYADEINELFEILGDNARFVANHYNFYDKIVISPSVESHVVLKDRCLMEIVKNREFTIDSYENNSIAIFIRTKA